MNNDFIQNYIDIKEISKENRPDTCLINNNERQISDICDFLQNNNKIMLINGFAGTGKSDIVNFVVENLNSDVLTIKYTCFETTILDDMLLSFLNTLKILQLKEELSRRKSKLKILHKK